MGRPATDLVGRNFGRLKVLQRAGSTDLGAALWDCHCVCGNPVIVQGRRLLSGVTTSCGCKQREYQQSAKGFWVHGHARSSNNGPSPTYISWQLMISRCYNTRNKDYANYGGRGIVVDERWHTFENFLADMGERPAGKTLDRKKNELGYAKANCRWATPKEQASNRRKRNGRSK